jgi:hypothetical protein
MSVAPSVCPHAATRLSLDGFSWNLIFMYVSKTCREKSGSVKTWQERQVLHPIYIYDTSRWNSVHFTVTSPVPYFKQPIFIVLPCCCFFLVVVMVDILPIVQYCRFIVEGRLTGLVTYCVRTAFCNTLLKVRLKGLRGRGRRFKQVLDDLKEKRRHWKLEEEALDRIVWRTRFRRGYGPVARQTALLIISLVFILLLGRAVLYGVFFCVTWYRFCSCWSSTVGVACPVTVVLSCVHCSPCLYCTTVMRKSRVRRYSEHKQRIGDQRIV